MKRIRMSDANSEQRMDTVQNWRRKLTPIAKVAPAQQRGSAGAGLSDRTCAVLGCERYKRLPNNLLFRFPSEPSLRRVWTEVTGRAGATDAGPKGGCRYVCAAHFTGDCVRQGVLEPGSVPTLELPAHVMQVEYINEEILDKEVLPKDIKSDSDSEPESSVLPHNLAPRTHNKTESTVKLELLKLFTDVQTKQKQVIALSKRLRHDRLMHRLRLRSINKLKEQIQHKQQQLIEKKAAKARLKSAEEPLDKNAILVLPPKYTDEVRSFALNIYDKSPEAYVYLRNTLRTLLPDTDEVEKWTRNGFQPSRVMTSNDCVKIVTEAKERELSCKIAIS